MAGSEREEMDMDERAGACARCGGWMASDDERLECARCAPPSPAPDPEAAERELFEAAGFEPCAECGTPMGTNVYDECPDPECGNIVREPVPYSVEFWQ